MSRRSILLVEDQAHVEHGHFPHSCVSLARALIALGCDVRLLTTRGLARDRSEPDGFAVEHFGAVSAAAVGLATRRAARRCAGPIRR